MNRRLFVLLLAAAMLLSGCALRTVDKMYSLPKRSDAYNDLQSVLDASMADLEFCAPLSGENQQTVQMADLDGDGVEEYLLFARGPSENPLQILIPVASIVWLFGIAVMLVYTAISYILLRRKVATAVLLQNRIYQSENVPSPFVLGILKPRIYLPFQLDAQSLNHVVAHEISHIRRRDHWWKPLGFLLLALHWFNPLIWVGYILLCRDIELACDEKVIKELDNENRASYTEALVACSIHRRAIAACPLAFGEVGVKERVKSVMNYKKPAFWIVVAAIVSCIVVAVCFLTNPKTSASNDPSLPLDIQDPNASQFVATVLEVHDTYLMVAPEGGSPLSYSDQVEVSLAGLEIPPALQVGETVLVVYDGYVQEIYPPRISTAYRVERLYLDSGPVETIYGNVNTYFRNTNGTWQTGGRNYKYRHVLTGRIPNAAQDTTFVYLSNLEHITFEQAYKAAGFSDNCADWFLVEDAILVEWSDVAPGGISEDYSSALNTENSALHETISYYIAALKEKIKELEQEYAELTSNS